MIAALILIVAGVALALAGYQWQKYAEKPGTPIPLEQLQKRYPGFVIPDGGFEYREEYGDQQLYRINSDGVRINLAKWHFKQQTGEFLKITQWIGSDVLVNPESYDKRFVNYYANNREAMGIIAVCVMAGSGFGLITALIYPSPVSFMTGIVALLLAVGIVPQTFKLNKSGIVGPEPLQRIISDFGASAPATPTRHPAQADLAYDPSGAAGVDLAYKPNA